jgi:DNA-binding CsgD family transcriptional regulator
MVSKREAPMMWREEMRVAPKIELSDEERAELERLVRSRLTSVRLLQRAQMVLLAAEGMRNKDIALKLGVGRMQVGALA